MISRKGVEKDGQENFLASIIPEIYYMLPHKLQLHFAIIF